MDIISKIKYQKKFLEDLGYNVLYIGLFGSQNYGLDDEDSDIDLRAIILPTLEQLIKKEKTSKKFETKLGLIDIKDVMAFYEVIRKGNFAYLEVIQTKWYIGDDYFRDLFGNIKVNLRSLKGDMYTKARAFSVKHVYNLDADSLKNKSKEIYHLIRMYYLVRERNVDKAFIDYSKDQYIKTFLMNVKRNKNNIINNLVDIDLSSFEKIKEWIEEKTKYDIPKEYEYAMVDLSKECVEYVKNKIIEELNQ